MAQISKDVLRINKYSNRLKMELRLYLSDAQAKEVLELTEGFLKNEKQQRLEAFETKARMPWKPRDPTQTGF